MIFQKKNKLEMCRQNKSGFVLLYVVFLSTIMLSISLMILGLTTQQLTITSTQKDSQSAFYSADSALECAAYWDMVQDDFFTQDGASVRCNGFDPIVTKTVVSSTVTRYDMEVTLASGGCAVVSLVKQQLANPPPDMITTISAYGYNTTCPSAGPSPRRVERGIQLVH